MDRSNHNSWCGRMSPPSTRRKYSTQVSALAEWISVARARSLGVRSPIAEASPGLQSGRIRSVSSGSICRCGADGAP